MRKWSTLSDVAKRIKKIEAARAELETELEVVREAGESPIVTALKELRKNLQYFIQSLEALQDETYITFKEKILKDDNTPYSNPHIEINHHQRGGHIRSPLLRIVFGTASRSSRSHNTIVMPIEAPDGGVLYDLVIDAIARADAGTPRGQAIVEEFDRGLG